MAGPSSPIEFRSRQVDPGGFELVQDDAQGVPKIVGYLYVKDENNEYWVTIDEIAAGDDPGGALGVFDPEGEVMIQPVESEYENPEGFRETHYDEYSDRRKLWTHSVEVEGGA